MTLRRSIAAPPLPAALLAALTAALAPACSLRHAGWPEDARPPRDAITPGPDVVVAPPDGSGECDPGQRVCAAECVNTATDPRHCGACGRDCTALPNVGPSATCAAGACVLTGACAPRFADCDRDAANGCETDLSRPDNCGACGAACPGTAPTCASSTASPDGPFACASGCTAPTMLCDGSCVDLLTNGSHCGACRNACPPPPDGRAVCRAGRCSFDCNAGFHPCGTRCVADTDPTACGGLCTMCVTPNATPACRENACAVGMCNGGRADCNGDPRDGCEVVLASDVENCGTCGTECSAPTGGVAVCTSGRCDFTCPAPLMRMGDSCGMGVPTNCGNRRIDAGEQCDDGNTAPGDGCNPACQLEWAAPDTCPGESQLIRIATGGAQIYSGSTSGAARNYECTSIVGRGRNSGDRAYLVAPTTAGRMTITLFGEPGFDAVLIVRDNCPGTSDRACQDRYYAGTPETFTLDVTPASRIGVIVDGYNGSEGRYSLRFSLM